MEVVAPRLNFEPDIAAMSAPHFNPADFVTPCGSPTEPPFMNKLPLPAPSPPSLGHQRLDAFDIVCLIGKGGFGKVFLVRHKATAYTYAMKVMEKDVLVERKAVRDAHSERNVLAMVGQYDLPFIVQLHVAFQTSQRVYLVMDFAGGGELMFHLRREAMLSEDAGRFYAAELLIALESLHDVNIVHRDIKPENVLLDNEGHLVLTDFGLAKDITGLGDQAHSWCGSEDYMAPEILARQQHTGKPADYWAYGVFIFDCLCGHPPFSPLHEKGKLTRKRLHDRILKGKYKLPSYLTPQCHSLLRKLLTKDPAKRLTDPAEIRKHPWFKTVDWEAIEKKQVTPPILPTQGSPTACFSPSLTSMAYSAPHSPLTLTAPSNGIPIPVAMENGTMAGEALAGQVSDAIWQGFSFVAPGMEVHFELAPAFEDRSPLHTTVPGSGFALTGSSAEGPVFLGPSHAAGDCGLAAAVAEDDPLVAELESFSLDAAKAVEIVDCDDV